jgi:spore coat polysaccharide biosynthesis protein SpsF
MTDKGRVVATIEARMTSSRLPGKVLKEAVGKPMLELMVERLRLVSSLDDIVIATTINDTDNPIISMAERLGVKWHRGSEMDVTERLLGAAEQHEIDVIVETTGDCPLIDPDVVDECVRGYLKSDVDYVSNILERMYPIGMDTQVFSTEVLKDVSRRTSSPFDRENCSVFIYKNPDIYTLEHVPAPPELIDPKLRLTLDTAEDYQAIIRIFEALYDKNPAFSLADILTFLKANPEVRAINDHVPHRYV